MLADLPSVATLKKRIVPAPGAVSVVPWIRMSAFFHLPVEITTRARTADGVAFAGGEGSLVRVPSVATTVNVYSVPAVSPVSVCVRAVVLAGAGVTAGMAVTWYEVAPVTAAQSSLAEP